MPEPGWWREFCRICKKEVLMQIFKNTGVCCELCRKVDIGEITKEEADRVASAPQES